MTIQATTIQATTIQTATIQTATAGIDHDWATAAYLQDELSAAELRIENLEAALVNARKIGAAIGIVMANEKLSYDDAFRALSLASQRANEKLRVLAERVLLTGSTAPWPA